MAKIVLIFKSQQIEGSPQEQVFVEAHDENGNSVNVGEWAADGEYESLTIDADKFTDKKRLNKLDEVHAIAVHPGNADANDYLRGMANGLILAQAIMSDGSPNFIDGPLMNSPIYGK